MLKIKNLRSKIVSRFLVSFNILNIMLKFKNKSILFYVLSLAINQKNEKGNIDILCVNKSIFADDISSLSVNSRSINYYTIDGSLLRIIFSHYCNKEKLLAHVDYHTDNSFDSEKLRYKKFLDRLILYLFKQKRYHGIMVCNYVYSYLQELAVVCESRKIPYIILHKEGLASPGEHRIVIDRYTNKKFIGTKLLVYNEEMQKAFTKSKLVNIDENKISVVGIPRLDKYTALRNTTGDSIVFFSFYPEDKFRHYKEYKEIAKEIDSLSIKFHRWIFRLAHDTNYKLYVKTKGSIKYLNFVNRIIKETKNKKNIVITNSINPYKLIRNSRFVVGFNSTTLIEGLVSGRNIIAPDFEGLGLQIKNDFFKNYPSLVNKISDYKSLLSLVRDDKINNNLINDVSHPFFYSNIYKNDGNSSLRTELEILKCIKS